MFDYQVLFSVISGMAVGSSLGVFGSGGSTLAIPLLIYWIGVNPKTAIAMSLVIVCCSALTGLMQNVKVKNLNLKVGLIFSLSGVIGSQAGIFLAQYMQDWQQLLLFSVVVMVASLSMVKKAFWPKLRDDEDENHEPPFVLSFTIGFFIGSLTGIIGVGGGFLIVPVLHSLGLNMKESIGTSLFIITINALAGALGYIRIVNYDFKVLIPFIIMASLASWIGAKIVQRIAMGQLKKVYAVFLLCIGIYLVARNSAVVFMQI